MVRAALCLVTFLIATPPAAAQTQTPRDTPNATTGTARIHGRVFDGKFSLTGVTPECPPINQHRKG